MSSSDEGLFADMNRVVSGLPADATVEQADAAVAYVIDSHGGIDPAGDDNSNGSPQ